MLCHVCETTFSELLDSVHDIVNHHSSHASLTSAATEGCFICSEIIRRIAVMSFPIDPHSLSLYTRWHNNRGGRGSWPKTIEVWIWHCGVSDVSQYGSMQSSHAMGFCFRRVVLDSSSDGKEARLRPTALSHNTSSAETISQIIDWQEQCTRTHDLCKQGREETWMPSRLLEIGDVAGTVTVHLRNRSQLQCSPYLTLSHCWGPTGTQKLKLTTESLASLRNGVAVSSLKPTFRDMADITRRLGIHLMWIDCLCIFQDDIEDWKHESASMGKIYSNSWLNVSANVEDNGSSGLFIERDSEHLVDYFRARSDENGEKIVVAVTRNNSWRDEVEASPVNRRGWVIQERILSPRIVHMSNTMAFWECRQFQASEVSPIDGLPDRGSPNNYSYIKRLCYGAQSQNPADVELDWWQLVGRYTMCGLTFETDRLIALSGLASKVHKRAQCDYLAGLWSTHLPLSLLWVVMNPAATRTKNYVAPSWSWASVNGWVWAPNLVFPPGSQIVRRRYARISSYETTLANPADKYGQVTSGKIELRAPLVTLDWSGMRGENLYRDRDVNISVPGESGWICKIGDLSSSRTPTTTLHFDCEGYSKLHTAYIAVVLDHLREHIASVNPDGSITSGSYSLQGLIITRLPCSRYMRIGIARLYIKTSEELEDIVNNLPEQDIVII